MPKVLVSDKLSETAVQIFRDRGIDVTFDPSIGKDKERLLDVIGDYDGLAIRSATKVSEKVLAAAPNLKGNTANPPSPKVKARGGEPMKISSGVTCSTSFA